MRIGGSDAIIVMDNEVWYCIESDGHCVEWEQSNGCPIHKCTREHNVQFCGLCKEFPCEWLIQKVVWRQNVVEELTELANLYRQQN